MVRLSFPSPAQPRPRVEFKPRVLASFSTEPGPDEPVEKRWTRVTITAIAPGQLLCEKLRGPEPLEQRSATVTNLESAKAFFGGGWVVKELFAALDPTKFPRWP